MRPFDAHDLTLPPEAVANGVYPFDAQLSEARRYLASRGITEVRALYGTARPAPRSTRLRFTCVPAANAGTLAVVRDVAA